MQDRIKEIRQNVFKTQHAFADFLNVTIQAVSKYEKGLTTIPTNNIKQLVESFNINPVWLLIGKGNMFLDKEANINFLSEIESLKKDNDKLKIENALLKELINNNQNR